MIDTPRLSSQNSPLLEIRNLSVTFSTTGTLPTMAVNSLSFILREQETLAIVGESGCGKSVTAFSIMGLLQQPGRIVSGEILFRGDDLRKAPAAAMQKLRGAAISMIFQEPMTSLNPVLQIGFQIVEALRLHRAISRKEAAAEAVALLAKVGIADPEDRCHAYPHQLSGGMRQRAMIAMALACSPQLLIADEPTTALDVTIQAQILDLIDSLKKQNAMSLLLITHNLGIVAKHSENTLVMYAGRAVESAPTAMVLNSPLHPYTKGLLASLPQRSTPGSRLPAINGSVTATAITQGCPYADRCQYCIGRCREEAPQLEELQPGHYVACWRAPLR